MCKELTKTQIIYTKLIDKSKLLISQLFDCEREAKITLNKLNQTWLIKVLINPTWKSRILKEWWEILTIPLKYHEQVTENNIYIYKLQ